MVGIPAASSTLTADFRVRTHQIRAPATHHAEHLGLNNGSGAGQTSRAALECSTNVHDSGKREHRRPCRRTVVKDACPQREG
jgi:hypothetical protein